MNILSIDYGQKRIGLAWTDDAMGVVLPYGNIKTKEHENIKTKIAELIKEERIDKVVIGLPVSLDGGENSNTSRIRDFVDALKKLVDIPIEFVDERFSSLQADQMGGDASRDEKAAMVILQSYLDKN